MIGNDFGYEYVFSRQLSVLASEGDLLITISCSGTSPNVVNAQKTATDMGLNVHQFPVFDKDRDYEKLEDEHLQLIHKVKKLL